MTKKKNIYISITVILISLMCSCDYINNELILNNTTEVYSDSSATINAETNSQRMEKIELRVVGNEYPTTYITKGAKTEQGYYNYIQWKPEMYEDESESIYMHTANLTYLDYATATQTYLCSVPGCQHNNESCTSFIRYPRGIDIFTNSTDTALLIRVLGAVNGEITEDGDLSRIYRLDKDGSNRTEIYKLPANESFNTYSNDRIIADEKNVYLAVTTIKSANEMIKEIRKINIDTGEAETLVEIPLNEMIVSAFDDKIITTKWQNTRGVPPDSEIEYQYENHEFVEGDLRETISYAYSVTDKTKTEILKWTTNTGEIVENYYLAGVTINDQYGKLNIHDLRTNEKKIVENIPSDKYATIMLTDFRDEKIIWDFAIFDGNIDDDNDIKQKNDEKEIVISKSNIFRYMIDVKTGEIKELTLKYNEGTLYESPVGILAETEENFLVLNNTDTDSLISLTDRDGIKHTYPYSRPVYALIDKDDYYNNIPNYRIIEDLI